MHIVVREGARRVEEAFVAALERYLRETLHDRVVFAAASVTAHNRSRLIGQRIGFIVPGNQLYIPELAMDLREHFRASKSRHADGLSPAAQAVLFHHILHLDLNATTPSAI